MMKFTPIAFASFLMTTAVVVVRGQVSTDEEGNAVIAGTGNTVFAGRRSLIGNGYDNNIRPSDDVPLPYGNSIVNGFRNNIHGASHSMIGGGSSNDLHGSFCFIGSGKENYIQLSDCKDDCVDHVPYFSSIVGGLENIIHGAEYSMIGGGSSNEVFGDHCFVGVGNSNTISSGTHNTIVGGILNEVSGTGSSIVGGDGNEITDNESFIGGGFKNEVHGERSVVVGGTYNDANGYKSFVGGGHLNKVDSSSSYGTIPGGRYNEILNAKDAFVAGNGGVVEHDSAAVFSFTTPKTGSSGDSQCFSQGEKTVTVCTEEFYINGVALLKKIVDLENDLDDLRSEFADFKSSWGV